MTKVLTLVEEDNMLMEGDGEDGSGSFTTLSLLKNSCKRIIN